MSRMSVQWDAPAAFAAALPKAPISNSSLLSLISTDFVRYPALENLSAYTDACHHCTSTVWKCMTWGIHILQGLENSSIESGQRAVASDTIEKTHDSTWWDEFQPPVAGARQNIPSTRFFFIQFWLIEHMFNFFNYFMLFDGFCCYLRRIKLDAIL